jgi:hypothetical protein
MMYQPARHAADEISQLSQEMGFDQGPNPLIKAQ